MKRANPLLRETLHGIVTPGKAHLDYLNYLLIQAVVVFAWWPKEDLAVVLQAGEAPATQLAALLVVGVSVAYYAVRAGAEEVLLPGQHGLRDWAAAAPLPLARILAGYVQGQMVHAVHLILLSSPLVLAAVAVSGGEWGPLGWSFGAILFQATFYRLAGAVVYMFIGHHGAMTFLAIRVTLLLGYVLAAAVVPAASHLVLSSRLLSLDAAAPAGAAGTLPAPLLFVLLYAALSGLALVLLHRQLARATARAEQAPGP